MRTRGQFIISLDFELFWGVLDKRTLESYGENIQNVHLAIPKILDLFREYQIHATWAYVGFLALEKTKVMLPEKLPNYRNASLCPYRYINNMSNKNSVFDKYHNARELMHLIKKTEHQELATHTYSHYYCLEPQENEDAFAADIAMAKRQGKSSGSNLDSIVFPRNQYNRNSLAICRRQGIKYFRGNPKSWAYSPHNEKGNSRLKRLFRFIDSYISLSGSRLSDIQTECGLINIPASSFFRPYSRKLCKLEFLKLRRIKKAMKHAAKTAGVYHLWWHPHNFGVDMDKHFEQLTDILEYYHVLKRHYGFMSHNMAEVGKHYE